MKDFTNKIVVITGAGSGMGRAYALEFARLGAKLALNDYDGNGLAETVALVRQLSSTDLYSAAFDVSDRAAMENFATEVKARLGAAHVVINNAGIEGSGKPMWATDAACYQRVMNINFFGVVNGTQVFLPQLLENGEGAIVNVSSIFGLIGPPNHTDYSASKFAVRGFTEALMVELLDSPISVHLVHPGGINTNITRAHHTQAFKSKYLSTPPEAIVRHVIRGIRRGTPKIVYGKDSYKTWLGANLVPLRLLNRIIWHDMGSVIDQRDYPPGPDMTSAPGQQTGKPASGQKKKVFAAVVSACVLAVAVWGWATYPRIGGEMLALATKIETSLYGLQRAPITLPDSNLMSWQGGPKDAAEAVVMIHGYSADKTVWMRFAPYFTDHYRVLILDLPGHGESEFDPALQYDSVSQSERVIQAMDTLGIARAHVIGNSMGGFIAAQMALHHPDRVQSATLIDAAGVLSPEPSEMDKMLAKGLNPFLIHSRTQFKDFYAMTMAQPPWVPGMTLDFIAEDYVARRNALAKIFQDFHHVNLLDEHLDDIQVPTLVMWGELDRLVHSSGADVWSNGISGAELITYPDLGHMPMVEDPARSARDVRKFIERSAKE